MRLYLVCFFTIVLLQIQAYSQRENLLEKYLLGKDKKAAASVFAEFYPFHVLSGGIGGSIGYGSGHFTAGITAFHLPLNDGFRDLIFENAADLEVNNSAVEAFFNYFLRRDRKGLYLGIIGGPEWFRLQDLSMGTRLRLTKAYILPRIGVRLFPLRWLYIDGSYGVGVAIGSTGSKHSDNISFKLNKTVPLPFLSVGLRYILPRNPTQMNPLK